MSEEESPGESASGGEERPSPQWASRVSRAQVERFYRTCGQGLVDEEAIDDLGVGLYARCLSLLGRIRCPRCRAEIDVGRPAAAGSARCGNCPWWHSREEYRRASKGKLLSPGRMKPHYSEFARSFPRAGSYGEKIVLIDTLIHRFHGELAGGKKPGAYALIDGALEDTAAFLDRLSYGERMPEEVRRRRQRWRERVGKGSAFWSGQLDGKTPHKEER